MVVGATVVVGITVAVGDTVVIGAVVKMVVVVVAGVSEPQDPAASKPAIIKKPNTALESTLFILPLYRDLSGGYLMRASTAFQSMFLKKAVI